MSIRPKKWLGQNFLTDRKTLEFEVSAAGVCGKDTVLEIGPGDGRLTRLLAERAKRVVAVEKDLEMAKFLEGLPENVELVFGDFTKLQPLPEFNKVVANIPYNLSSKIAFILLEGHGFEVAVLTFQKEFAERLVGRPGTKNWGRLSATVSFLANVELLKTVPAGAFYPKPKVDSAVVRIIPKEKPEGWESTKRAINALFTNPGKTVKNALKGKTDSEIPEEFRGKRVRRLSPGELEALGAACFRAQNIFK
ncbi:MAG: 16S rRNA (adenine(1518)-N(6)/adenine(1519)-N(6))-dimethyltransferase RsmA [archaeon]